MPESGPFSRSVDCRLAARGARVVDGRLLRAARPYRPRPRASGRGGGRGGRGSGDHRASSSQKAMPLEIRVIGTAEPHPTVVGPRADHRRADLGQLQGRRRRRRRARCCSRSIAGRSKRRCSRRRPTSQRDTAQAANAQAQAAALPGPGRSAASRRASRSTRRGPTPRRSRRRVGADRAAVENAKVQLQYATITRADLRPHRRADGARGQPRARQRHDAARDHQPDHADLRLVRRSRSAAARAEALHGAAARCSVEARAAQRRRAAVGRHASPSSTTRSIRRPARSRSRARSRTPIGGSGPASSSTSSVTLTTDPTRDRRADGGGADRPAGPVRVRRQAGPDGRAARRSTVARARGDETVIKDGLQGRRDGRHRRPAAARAGQPRQRQAGADGRPKAAP